MVAHLQFSSGRRQSNIPCGHLPYIRIGEREIERVHKLAKLLNVNALESGEGGLVCLYKDGVGYDLFTVFEKSVELLVCLTSDRTDE